MKYKHNNLLSTEEYSLQKLVTIQNNIKLTFLRLVPHPFLLIIETCQAIISVKQLYEIGHCNWWMGVMVPGQSDACIYCVCIWSTYINLHTSFSILHMDVIWNYTAVNVESGSLWCVVLKGRSACSWSQARSGAWWRVKYQTEPDLSSLSVTYFWL